MEFPGQISTEIYTNDFERRAVLDEVVDGPHPRIVHFLFFVKNDNAAWFVASGLDTGALQ